MNSTSATTAPARSAMASPSPVAIAGIGGGGVEVPGAAGREDDGPAAHEPDPPVRRQHRQASRARPGSVQHDVDRLVPGQHRRQVRGPSSSARSISAPVASPPAWITRLAECPPSRVRSSPSGPASNAAPRADQPRHRGGSLGEDQRHRGLLARDPLPATRVSSMCASTQSPSSRSSRTTATPPCAHWVLASSGSPLVTSSTGEPGPRRVEGGGQPGDARCRRRRCRRSPPTPAAAGTPFCASLPASRLPDRDHPLDGAARPGGDLRIDATSSRISRRRRAACRE